MSGALAAVISSLRVAAGGGGSTPEIIGTPISFTTTGATIAVPADAQAVIVFWSFWSATAGAGIATLTLGGASAFTIREDLPIRFDNAPAAGCATATITTTGNQTLAFTFDAATGEGPNGWLVFIKTINTADFYRDSDSVQNNNTSTITATCASVATDLVVVMDQKFGSTAPPAAAGATSRNTMTNNSESSRLLSVNAPGASTTSYTAQSPDFSTVCIVSIKAAA